MDIVSAGEKRKPAGGTNDDSVPDKKRAKHEKNQEAEVEAKRQEDEEDVVETVDHFVEVAGAYGIQFADGNNVGLPLKEHLALERILRAGHVNDFKHGVLKWSSNKYLVVADDRGMPFLFKGGEEAASLEVIKFTNNPPPLLMLGSDVAKQHADVLLRLLVDTLIEGLYDLGDASILDFVQKAMVARKPHGSFVELEAAAVHTVEAMFRAYCGQIEDDDGHVWKLHVEKAECLFNHHLAASHCLGALLNVRSEKQSVSTSLVFHSASGVRSIKSKGMAVADAAPDYDTYRFFSSPSDDVEDKKKKKKKQKPRDQCYALDPTILARHPKLQRRGSVKDEGLFYVYVLSALDFQGDSNNLMATGSLVAHDKQIPQAHANTLRFYMSSPETEHAVLPLFRALVRAEHVVPEQQE